VATPPADGQPLVTASEGGEAASVDRAQEAAHRGAQPERTAAELSTVDREGNVH
jgi:hypothetical protein